MEEDLADFTARLQRETNRKYALMVAKQNIDPVQPRRLLSGILLSGEGRNANHDRFRAAGMTMTLPLPLLRNHSWNEPAGLITAVEIRGKEVHVKGEIFNRGEVGFDTWMAIVEQRMPALSMAARNVGQKVVDATFVNFQIDEVSLCEVGADSGARILRCAERAPHVRLDQPWEVVFWSRDL